MSLLISILYGLLALGVLVLIHELGHFTAAKLFGVRVEIFSLGLGHGILKYKKGDTVYQLGYIPLGGFCKMAGEEPSDELTGADYEFYSKPPSKRLVILVAGPFMNYLLGIILLIIINSIGTYSPTFATKIDVLKNINLNNKTVISPAYKAGLKNNDEIVKLNGEKIVSWNKLKKRIITAGDENELTITVKRKNKFVDIKVKPIINQNTGASILGIIPFIGNKIEMVEKESPAYKAKLKPEDTILAINGKHVNKFLDIKKIMKKYPGKTVRLKIKRKNRILNIKVKTLNKNNSGYLGVSFYVKKKIIRTKSKNIFYAVYDSIKMGNKMVGEILYGLKIMFSGKVKVRKAVSGPAKIVYFAGEIAQKYGILNYLFIVAYISIALAFFNLLPIPAVDGSYILFFLFEIIFRKELNYKVLRIIQNAGLILITLLGVLIIFNDIWSLSKGQTSFQQHKSLIETFMI